MARASVGRKFQTIGRVGFVAGLLGAIPVGSCPEAAAQAAPVFVVDEPGVVPRRLDAMTLLGWEPIQFALRLTAAQVEEQNRIVHQAFQELRQRREGSRRRVGSSRTRDGALREINAALGKTLTLVQSERLEQIRIQLEGPLAFSPAPSGPGTSLGRSLPERLELSDDQIQQIGAIVREGEDAIARAARFTIDVGGRQGIPNLATLRTLVENPEFQAARQNARKAGREASAAVLRQVEAVLTDTQRRAYRKLRGPALTLSGLVRSPQTERAADLERLAAAFGHRGQRVDPGFDPRVAHPAYTAGARRPRVLIDEAHHNLHVAGGGFRPFAELIAHDGYQVSASGEPFTPDLLRKADVLVIVNALGAEGMDHFAAAHPAFTEAECSTVRDWVAAGGRLLLVSDRTPMGAASEGLAKRLGVEMAKGITLDPPHAEVDPSCLIFRRSNHLIGDHPITRGRDESERINLVQTYAGTSLKGPAGSTPLLKLSDSAIDRLLPAGQTSAAGRAQGVAFRLGRGRVVVMGEAAGLTAQVRGAGESFGMNVPGLDNRQLALNIMHWLSGVLEPDDAAR